MTRRDKVRKAAQRAAHAEGRDDHTLRDIRAAAAELGVTLPGIPGASTNNMRGPLRRKPCARKVRSLIVRASRRANRG